MKRNRLTNRETEVDSFMKARERAEVCLVSLAVLLYGEICTPENERDNENKRYIYLLG